MLQALRSCAIPRRHALAWILGVAMPIGCAGGRGKTETPEPVDGVAYVLPPGMSTEELQPAPAVQKVRAVGTTGFVTVTVIDLDLAGAATEDDALALFYAPLSGLADPRPFPRRPWEEAGWPQAWEVDFSAGANEAPVFGRLRGVVVQRRLWLLMVAGEQGGPFGPGGGGAQAFWDQVRVQAP